MSAIIGIAPAPRHIMDLSNYVVVDVETTGLAYKQGTRCDDVIEVGALKVNNGQVVGEFQRLVRWWVCPAVPEMITSLTGITSDMLVQSGHRPEEVMREFLQFVGDLPLVAHNAAFDRGFLYSTIERCQSRCESKNLPPLPELKNDFFDTMAMARKLYSGSHSLGNLAQALNIRVEVAHRALADCYTAHYLLQIMMRDCNWDKWWANRVGWKLYEK